MRWFQEPIALPVRFPILILDDESNRPSRGFALIDAGKELNVVVFRAVPIGENDSVLDFGNT